MESILFAVIAGFPALVGIGSLISAACISFYNVKGGADEYIVVPVKGHMEDIEFRIRGAVARRRGARQSMSVIYVTDFGADSETAEIAKRMCREFEMVEWVDSFELTKRIRDNLNTQK